MRRSLSYNSSRRARSKTFSGLSTDTLIVIKDNVPPILEDIRSGGDSSTGENSSPETPTEQEFKYEQKENKKQRKKKNRRQKIVMSPPADVSVPMFFEDDIKHRDGGLTKKYSYEEYRGNSLVAPKVEKSSSFKRKTKPAYLDSLMARETDNKSPTRPDSRNNGNKKESEYNIILLGDFGVGKTAFAVRFVTRRYLHEYDPTLERSYEKQIQCSTGLTKVRLWDTVNKSFEPYTDNADGFIVMYATTSSQSAHNAQNIINSIRSSKYAAVRAIPIMLLGTKAELEHARKVRSEDQEKFAKQHGCSWKEISVACSINIDGYIKTLVEEIILTDNGNTHSKLTSTTSLSRKPSAAKKHIMKGLLSKKKEKS